MAKSDYILNPDDAFGGQLETFKSTIGSYAGPTGVTPAQVAAQAADGNYFNYVVTCQRIMQKAAQQWTAWCVIVRKGGELPTTGVPALPTLPAAVPPVAPGVEPRFRALAKQIKSSTGSNDATEKALGIAGPEQSAPDLATLQPDFGATLSGNQVTLNWGWGGHSDYLDMIRLEVDRGDGKGFVFLAMDTTPGYTDSAPFPTAPAKWTYRGIYLVEDAPVGQWSKPVSVTVGA